MNHDEFRAAYLEGRVGPEEERHLRGCVECRGATPQLDTTRALLSDPTIWDEPDPELQDRVVAAFERERPAPVRTSRRWLRVAAPAVAVAMAAVVWVVTRPTPPDWTVDLPGVESAAEAMATVSGWNVEAGTRMQVHVDNLGAAPAGFVYEFWMSQGRNHVSAGSFLEAGSVELVAGVSRKDFPRLWITLEPLDGNTAPTGAVVLDTG
jgi:hypothetical protein